MSWRTNKRTRKPFMIGGKPANAPRILEKSSSHEGFYEGSDKDLLESVNILLRDAEDAIDNPRYEEHEIEFEYLDSEGKTHYTMNEDEAASKATKGNYYKYPTVTWSILMSGGDGKMYDLAGSTSKRGTRWVSGAELSEAE